MNNQQINRGTTRVVGDRRWLEVLLKPVLQNLVFEAALALTRGISSHFIAWDIQWNTVEQRIKWRTLSHQAKVGSDWAGQLQSFKIPLGWTGLWGTHIASRRSSHGDKRLQIQHTGAGRYLEELDGREGLHRWMFFRFKSFQMYRPLASYEAGKL